MSEIYCDDPPDWNGFRRQMPIANKWVYLDHAAVAPLSAAAQQAMTGWADQAACDGTTRWPDWSRQLDTFRASAARLVGAEADEIALIRNTTTGISLVAEGFPWQPGDNVVTLENEFPSNLYPWMHLESRGVECRRVPVDYGRVDLDRIADTCDARTRIVSASWIGYASGWRNDVAALARVAHDNGSLLFLDAIQGLGVFPLNVVETGVDFLAADGHKWLLGPEGAGILYVGREHIGRLRPFGVGWHSVKHEHDFNHIELDLKPSAARFEGGSENMAGFIGLAASLNLLLHFGPAKISQRILDISDFACSRLTAAGATIESCRYGNHRSGIVSFTWPQGDMKRLRHDLLQQGIVLSFRGGRLRISPHAYNTESDIERLVAALQNPS